MQTRDWLWGGLAHPPSALARTPSPSAPRIKPGTRVLLVGDLAASWLAVPFGKLCQERGAQLRVSVLQPQDEISYVSKILEKANEFQPKIVLIIQKSIPGWTATRFVQAAGATLRLPASVAWVRHPAEGREFKCWLKNAKIPSFHSELLDIPLAPSREPTALGYAAWAGALWRWLK